MKKWFIKMSAGEGMNSCEIIEALNEEYAKDEARSLCVELAESYGYYQDEGFFGERDSVGLDWSEDEEDYMGYGTLDYYVEEYCADRHDGYLY